MLVQAQIHHLLVRSSHITGMMLPNSISFLFVLFLFLGTYSLCISGATLKFGNVLRSDQLITPDYGIDHMNRSSFPDGFIFGSASAAYQIEGAWNLGGRGPSNWDYFTHNYPEKIADGSNGDYACNSYFMYQEDISIMKKIGLDSYRFSIAWSRIIPTGRRSDGVNEEGIRYYLRVIRELIRNDIEPCVTLFHWDVPQALEEAYGGFLDRRIVDDFRDYADLCFERFGHLVKTWITLNEPYAFSTQGYELGNFAPGHCSSWLDSSCLGGDSATEPYLTAHYQILGHAAAVKLYREKYQASQKGKIGVTLVTLWLEPYTDTTADIEAAKRKLEFMLGWFMRPVVYGDYPPIMRLMVGDRLPKFTESESKDLRKSFDYMGMNYYMGAYVRDISDQPYHTNFSYSGDARAEVTFLGPDGKPIGPEINPGSFYVYPEGLGKLLNHMKCDYEDPIIYVTENGVLQLDHHKMPMKEALNDTVRVTYYHDHLTQVLNAIKDGVNIAGYYAWSIFDNFEWNQGYTQRYGINYIEFDNEFKRHEKLSAKWFSNFMSIRTPTATGIADH